MFSGDLALIVSLTCFGDIMHHELPEKTAKQLMDSPAVPVFAGSIPTFVIGEPLFGVSVTRTDSISRGAAGLSMIAIIPAALRPTDVLAESVVVIGSIVAGLVLVWWVRSRIGWQEARQILRQSSLFGFSPLHG